jgi:hypothetical protein
MSRKSAQTVASAALTSGCLDQRDASIKVRGRVLLIRSSVGKVVMLTTLFSVKNAGHPHFMLGVSLEDAIENGYVKDER